MNREIKFRQPLNGDWHYWGFGIDESLFEGPLTGNGAQKIPSYQFTGIKDKNGKEVFEGDILQIICDFEQRKGNDIDKVGYSDGTFYCNDWTLNELIYNRRKGTQEWEVIGNVYYNANLLPQAPEPTEVHPVE